MQNWYARASENQRIDRDRDGRGQMVMFFQAMVQLLSSFNRPESFPPTFNFDITRLWRLRSDVRDTVNLGVCTVLFAVLLDRAGHSEPPTSDMLGSLRFSCLSILEDFDGEARWGQHIEHIALEITRSAHRVCGSTHLSSDLEFAEDFISEAVGSGLGCWSQMQKNVEVELWSSLQAHVNVYEKMSPLDMLSHAETYTNVASRPLSFEFDCIARRIAHIGMLHWRVWAPLIYLRQNPTSSTSDPMT